ncbi:hypothetical protein, partial [Streptomyces sp. rh206]|uniref:hypothetical protein n=1 Tax=Streptomyces sp. rh206 TaxID=2034270 RepID=UPI001C54C60A
DVYKRQVLRGGHFPAPLIRRSSPGRAAVAYLRPAPAIVGRLRAARARWTGERGPESGAGRHASAWAA